MRRRKKMDDEAAVDMTPMLDVVFILLIFFIVTSTFLNDVGIDLTPPPPSPETNQPTKKAVNIYIDESNLIRIDNRPTDVSAVRANIERMKAENPETSVAITSHPDAKNQFVLHIVDQAKLANIENVNVSVALTE